MQQPKLAVLILMVILLLAACSIEPKTIEYGKDACSFCKMNIIDNQHVSQFVTKKGKVYVFDSIECMVRALNKKDEKDIALFVIADYASPGKFINAVQATYLISENIQSPMGANLSGFISREAAREVQKEKSGTLYSWKEIKAKF
jgi:copper chaperone NosL